MVGSTSSADFPVAAAVQPANGGGQDSFVLKLSSAGGIVWSTYLGGGGSESNPVVAIGPEGEVQVGGVTSSSDFPLVRALDSVLSGPSDGFLVKLADPFRLFVATRPGPAGVGSVE